LYILLISDNFVSLTLSHNVASSTPKEELFLFVFLIYRNFVSVILVVRLKFVLRYYL